MQRQLRVYLSLGATAACLAACASETHQLDWRFDFSSPELRARAARVEAEIRRGGCDGEVVFSTRAARGEAVASPGTLRSGRYGFFGRAQDEDCVWFAQACVTRELPTNSEIIVVLTEANARAPDPGCFANDADPINGGDAQAGGSPVTDAGGSLDASLGPGEKDGSAGISDASSLPADAGLGRDAASGRDAGPGTSVDAAAANPLARCTALDDAVVACYDFDDNLLDDSPFLNHASSTNALFEPTPMGKGLRMIGQRVSVVDDVSLNLSRFTIELWFKPDSLVNLSGNANETVLLIDKDQQYGAGHDSRGRLFAQVYRARESLEATTAGANNLTPGTWVYAAYSYDGATTRLYRDGVEIDREEVDLALFSGSGGTMHIGSGSPESTRAFNGVIDAVRISNVKREPDRICAEAGKSFSGGVCN